MKNVIYTVLIITFTTMINCKKDEDPNNNDEDPNSNEDINKTDLNFNKCHLELMDRLRSCLNLEYGDNSQKYNGIYRSYLDIGKNTLNLLRPGQPAKLPKSVQKNNLKNDNNKT